MRNSAKAIIAREGYLLTIKIHENDEPYYILPGGGQEHGENLHEALIRECKEEIDAEIEIGTLLFIREYIGKNHEFASYHGHVHQTEFLFLCKTSQHTFSNGTNPDKGQAGIEWLPIKDLQQYKLYPQALKKHLIDYFETGEATTYLGDIN